MARGRAGALKTAALTLLLVCGLACAGAGAWIISRDERSLDEYAGLAEKVSATQAGGDEAEDEGDGEGIDWAALLAINADTVGWLSVDGTEISMPVTQTGESWPDKYLSYSFYGEESQVGCPYLNWQCDADGRAVTVYGHHVWYSKRMFNELAYTYDQGNFDTLGDAWWSTPASGSTRFRPVGAARIHMSEGEEWNKVRFGSAQDVRAWLREVMTDFDAVSDDAEELADNATRVLILATCTGDEGWSDTTNRCVTVFADTGPLLAGEAARTE